MRNTSKIKRKNSKKTTFIPQSKPAFILSKSSNIDLENPTSETKKWSDQDSLELQENCKNLLESAEKNTQ